MDDNDERWLMNIRVITVHLVIVINDHCSKNGMIPKMDGNGKSQSNMVDFGGNPISGHQTSGIE